MPAPADDSFARDLGYLDKFFDKIEAHAASVGGASGARLKELMGEERARWREIRGLLGGGAPAARGPSAAAPPASSLSTGPADPAASPSATGRATRRLTVGSLIRRP